MPLRMPNEVACAADRIYAREHRSWLLAPGDFPVALPLGKLTEREFMTGQAAVQAWLGAWRSWSGPGRVLSREYRWPLAGRHELPEQLELNSAEDVAAVAGVDTLWETLKARFAQVTALVEDGAARADDLVKLSDSLLGYPKADWNKLLDSLTYFLHGSDVPCFVRQLPIQGVDTKWITAHESDITRLMKALTGAETSDFHELCGIRRKPHRVRIRLLDQALRDQVGGFGDIELPVDDLANGPLRPARVLIIENEEPGLALTDMPGTLAVVGMGYSVAALQRVEWMRGVPSLYWGDVDTDGLLIYACAQRALPRVQPVMMDLATLDAHRAWCVPEPKPHQNANGIAPEQQALFEALVRPSPWQGLRLEQERIPWSHAWEQLERAWSVMSL